MRTLRPGLFRRRKLAVDTVRAYDAPRVLDVGCGSGRIGEFVLEAGASHYVGVDFSEPMIDLSRARLERFAPQTELIVDDFLTAPLEGPFEVILAVGLFDYLPEPYRFSRRMFELCAPGGCVVGSFPTWSLLKGPVRKVRYEWIGNCPIFNYSRRELELMFGASGFDAGRDREPRPQRLPRARVPDVRPEPRRRQLDASRSTPWRSSRRGSPPGESTRSSAAAR